VTSENRAPPLELLEQLRADSCAHVVDGRIVRWPFHVQRRRSPSSRRSEDPCANHAGAVPRTRPPRGSVNLDRERCAGDRRASVCFAAARDRSERATSVASGRRGVMPFTTAHSAWRSTCCAAPSIGVTGRTNRNGRQPDGLPAMFKTATVDAGGNSRPAVAFGATRPSRRCIRRPATELGSDTERTTF